MKTVRSNKGHRLGPGRHRSVPKRGARRGLVLVASVGVLGVISVMGLAFATVMRLESRAAQNYSMAVRAEFVARAGLEDAIGRLRIMAREGSEFAFRDGQPAEWYTWRGTAGGAHKVSFPARRDSNWYDDDGDGVIDNAGETGLCSYTDGLGDGGFCTLKIEDAASKINVNVGDNLGTILDNLCRVIGSPLRAADQRALVPKWFTDLKQYRSYKNYNKGKNFDDRPGVYDLFYKLGPDDRPVCLNRDANSVGKDETLYGDGYAIAGYRARHGEFLALEDVRNAIPWIERGDGDGDGDDPDGDGQMEPEADMPEEILEVEAKYAAIKPYITIDSWTDTDQIGYGKFEVIRVRPSGNQDTPYWAYELTDRNACWNIKRNPQMAGWIPASNTVDGQPYAGELKGCFVAIMNGVGQYQVKTIAANTADTIILSESFKEGSEMRIPPNQHSSYILLGRDGGTDEDWQQQLKLYARQPLSFHRAPVNINTVSDKVLTAVLMGLQTTWGRAGYLTEVPLGANINDMGGWAGTSTDWADAMWQCPSIISIGRDDYNAYLTFDRLCPNDDTFVAADANQLLYGHSRGREPFCFFCSFGHLRELTSPKSRPTYVNEAHYLAWQILKEREQTEANDLIRGDEWSNGYGPFRGWDDVFYRVFYPHEKGIINELHTPTQNWVGSVASKAAATSSSSNTALATRHPGIARLCMANFNSNTDLLKFQPNLEYIDRWGPNFTDLYVPYPDFLRVDNHGDPNAEMTLRTRPGELLDKSDLNIGTTEFSFDSGGVYDIVSTGRIYDKMSTVIAERKYRALVKIYDVWRETTQREFTEGIIDAARGDAGTRQAGSYTLDGAGDGDPRDFRKALATYPEAIVPKGHTVGLLGTQPGGATEARLAYDKYNDTGIKPAGFDGQILLATNMYQDPRLGLDPSIGFYHSFTGDIIADAARGDARPGWTTSKGPSKRDFVPDTNYCPIDVVSILGTLDSKEYDVKPTNRKPGKPFGPNNPIIEGEGVGGDFRPDGLHMGVTGKAYKDGSFEFGSIGNWDRLQGAFTMWIKPRWHQGTRTCASLPVTYVPHAGIHRGSTACIGNAGEFGPEECLQLKNDPDWGEYWPLPAKSATYESKDAVGKDARGYVRDRFEYELWNSVVPDKGMKGMNWRLFKAGDTSGADSDWQGGRGLGRAPNAALNFSTDVTGDFNTWIPGSLAAGNDGGQPFWQVAPFRWTFLGKVWDWSASSADPRWYLWPAGDLPPDDNQMSWHARGEGEKYFGDTVYGGNAHRISGQPQDMPTVLGDCRPGDDVGDHTRMSGIWEYNNGYPTNAVKDFAGETVGGGQGKAGFPQDEGLPPGFVAHVPFGHTKDHTAPHLAALLVNARPFCDGMLTWNKTIATPAMDNGSLYSRISFTLEGGLPVTAFVPLSYDFGDHVFEQYSAMLKQWTHTDKNANWDAEVPTGINSFGMNRNITKLQDEVGDLNLYQSAFAGTFATIDEYQLHLIDEDLNFVRNINEWARKQRNKTGRYYTPIDPARPIYGQVSSEDEPAFTSQNMYLSEQRQSFIFGMGEEEDELEICTVRWTTFTPFYCVDKGAYQNSRGTDTWRFPFDSYFNSDTGDSRFESTLRGVASPAQISLYYSSGGTKGKFTMAKYGAAPGATIQSDIRNFGVASRYSSQRGCVVKIQARDAAGGLQWFPPDRGDFYEHPEGGYLDVNDIGCTVDGWQQVLLDPKQTTRQHPKCKPMDLKYKVFFRLSDLEYRELYKDASKPLSAQETALVDSPVFDDITITVMRSPKVLEWRDVSE